MLLLACTTHGLLWGSDATAPRTVLEIPRLERPPALDAFLTMAPVGNIESRMAKVDGFIQREPSDGKPGSEITEAYLGYDEAHLYVVFACFDSEPKQIRAHMSRREITWGDDRVTIVLDTFDDHRRAYYLASNPFGVQLDAVYTEGTGFTESSGSWDYAFETVWHTRGKLTDRGYVVLYALPFKSFRFSRDSRQTWGLILKRRIPRYEEEVFWPRVTSKEQGVLHQTAKLVGIEDASPGRNVQFIPFGVFRSFRALDTRDSLKPRFVRDRGDLDAGLDAKVVIRDSLVLDVALNPDFSQVESDEPQVSVNQRFELFFPELRPFFMENSAYFHTPITLLFTRRIADPQFGVRLSGKLGHYNVGVLLADDQSPGRIVPTGDTSSDRRAYFGVLRLSRDVFKQSTIGLMFTDREFRGSFNRVGGIDGQFKLNKNWTTTLQAVTSSTKLMDGRRFAGPAYEAHVKHSGKHLLTYVKYSDRSPGFNTLAGFNQRVDVRGVSNYVRYRFRPEGKRLVAWGPVTYNEVVWDHTGTRLDWRSENDVRFEFKPPTSFGLFYNNFRERLRPKDFGALVQNQDYSYHSRGVFFHSAYFRWLTLDGFFRSGTRINFVPASASGQPPVLAHAMAGDFTITVRPVGPLRIDNTYLFERLRARNEAASIVNNHIVRSKWNWQLNRELSLRMILQYNTVLANRGLTSLETAKNFNADFLITYLLNPGTALYFGYNGNAQNIDLIPTTTGSLLVRRQNQFINDSKQFFVKLSYLFRF